MKIEQFKIRCSEIAQIMTNPRSKSETLSETTKTYCKLWGQEKLYNRKKIIESKYFEKGNLCEAESINYYNAIHSTNFVKNTERKENTLFTGECDIDTGEAIFDFKNAYDFDKMPIFDAEPAKANWMQVQGYMHLWGRTKGGIIKVLSDMPGSMMRKMAIFESRKHEISEEEAYEKIKNHYTYFDVPDKLKIVQFNFEYHPIFIKNVENRVIECRNYINDLLMKG